MSPSGLKAKHKGGPFVWWKAYDTVPVPFPAKPDPISKRSEQLVPSPLHPAGAQRGSYTARHNADWLGLPSQVCINAAPLIHLLFAVFPRQRSKLIGSLNVEKGVVGLLILRVRTDRGPSAPATVSPPYTFRSRNICCFFWFFCL